MCATESGTFLLEKFRTTNSLTTDDRILIVQHCVEHLLSLPLEKQFYPTDQQKKDMAMAIVEFFPCLRSEEEGVRSYFSFYDPIVGGFIDTRLKTVRRKLPIENRKRKCSKGKDNATKKRLIHPPGFLTVKQTNKSNECDIQEL